MKFCYTLLLAISGVLSANGQVAVKTNLIYDAMTTPNLGIEVGVAGKSTLNLVYGLNAWTFSAGWTFWVMDCV